MPLWLRDKNLSEQAFTMWAPSSLCGTLSNNSSVPDLWPGCGLSDVTLYPAPFLRLSYLTQYCINEPMSGVVRSR